MKRLLLAFAFLALAIASRADDFDLDRLGRLSIQVPAGWTLANHAEGNVLTLILSPKNQANARGFLAVSPARSALLSPENVESKFAAVCQQFAPKSVEKKAAPQAYKLAQGHGTYAVFTDARLVGKPSRPGDYKIVSPGIIQLSDHIGIFAFLGADDATGPEMTALRAAVESLRLTPPGPATVSISLPDISVGTSPSNP